MPDLAEALYTCGVLIALGVALIIKDLYRPAEGSVEGPGSGRKSRFTLRRSGALLIGCGLLMALAQFMRNSRHDPQPAAREDQTPATAEPRPESIRGVLEDGGYRNEYFGLRLPLRDGWHPIDRDSIRQAAGRSKNADQAESILLGLAKAPQGDAPGASLMLTAERIGPRSIGMTGRQYLSRMLNLLERHPEPPRDARLDSAVTYAGTEFHRLSLRRPVGDGEVGMTYWAGVKNGYVLTFAGSYASEDGREEVQRLFDGLTTDEGS